MPAKEPDAAPGGCMDTRKTNDPQFGLGPDQMVPANYFRECTGRLDGETKRLDRRIAQVANLRLAAFLAGAGCAVGFGVTGLPLAAWIGSLLLLAGFIALVVLHERLHRTRSRTAALYEINREAWKRLTDSWHDIPNDGASFADPAHACSGDLDLFGPGSLYQWCCTAETPAGRKALAGQLTDPVRTPDAIRRRQEAVRELAGQRVWRQELQADARLHRGAFCEAADLERWATQPAPLRLDGFGGKLLHVAVWVLPVLTLLCAMLALLAPMVPRTPLLVCLLAETLLAAWRLRARNAALQACERAAADVGVHQRLIGRFEALPVQSGLLMAWKDRLKDGHGRTASAQTKRLAAIVDAIGNRHHQLYIVVAILFQLDWHFLFAAEAWRRESGIHLPDWVAVNGDLEAVCALAGIADTHPDWGMPEPVQPEACTAGADTARLLAQSVGHPLLKAPCVTNSIAWDQGVSVHLITGSNMSGKSTLLRTLGVNLVLAMAGAPVYAEAFRFTPCGVFTCMRIRDDIEQGISSFYAELVRIRALIEAVSKGERVFFLLDELFKGTNSADRHAGAEALVRWLVAQDRPDRPVLGLISTHDLELGSLETQCSGVRNAHFQEHYEQGSLQFDYRLRPGVSTTRNARWLMRLAGLPMEP